MGTVLRRYTTCNFRGLRDFGPSWQLYFFSGLHILYDILIEVLKTLRLKRKSRFSGGGAGHGLWGFRCEALISEVKGVDSAVTEGLLCTLLDDGLDVLLQATRSAMSQA